MKEREDCIVTKPVRLSRPSDHSDYGVSQPGDAGTPAPPADPASKLPWQTALVKRSHAEGLSPSVQHIALVLSTYSNRDGTNAYPPIKTLVEVTGRSQSTVTRALRDLREKGWVRQESKGSGFGGRASVYRLTIPS